MKNKLTQINISKWPRSNFSNELIFTCNNKMWFITARNRIICRLSWHSEKKFSRKSLSQKIGLPTHSYFYDSEVNQTESYFWKWFINIAAVWNESYLSQHVTVQIDWFDKKSISFFSFSFGFGFQMSKIRPIQLPENSSFPLF